MVVWASRLAFMFAALGMIKHAMQGFPENSQLWQDSLENLMLNAVDEIERARLNPKIGYGPNST